MCEGLVYCTPQAIHALCYPVGFCQLKATHKEKGLSLVEVMSHVALSTGGGTIKSRLMEFFNVSRVSSC